MERRLSPNSAWVLIDKPRVYFASGKSGVETVLDVGKRGDTVLVNPLWYVTAKSLVQFTWWRIKCLSAGIKMIVMCNDDKEMKKTKCFGIPSFMCNQNQFFNEKFTYAKERKTSIVHFMLHRRSLSKDWTSHLK